MNNSIIAGIVRQTGRLMEFDQGSSFLSDELIRLAERIKYLEVPLEVFSSVDLGIERETQELEGMLGYWFGDFSDEAVWHVREVVLTGTNPIRDELLRKISPNVVRMLKIRELPAEGVGFIRSVLGIRDVEKLKKACLAKVLSGSGKFSEKDELEILEELNRIENEREQRKKSSGETPSESEFISALEYEEPDVSDPDTMFHANADALADAIIQELSKELKSPMLVVSEATVKETLEDVRDQALDAVGKFKKFFTSRTDPRYRQMRLEEDERARVTAARRAQAEQEEKRAEALRRPLSLVKVGALGRGEPALTQLDFLIRTDDTEIAFERVKKSDFVKEVLQENGRLLSASLKPDFFTMPYNKRPTPPTRLNFYTASNFTWGVKEILLTSSKEYWQTLVARAERKGMQLYPSGLYRGVCRVTSSTTERLYEKLGTPMVPDELRQGIAVQKWLDDGTPELIRLEDMHGDLHMHSTYSDGKDNIEAMAVAAVALGHEYIALTDHTKRSEVGNGMPDEDFLQYWKAIDRANTQLRNSGSSFKLLKGAEVDILEEGGLDLPDDILAQADWIVVSMHYGKRQSREQILERYLDAMRNPYVDAVAHPTERVIGVEGPMDYDIEFLCKAARHYGKCLELNSQPRRLDLDYKWLKMAKDFGVPVVISTDSHEAKHLEYIHFGVEQARRAGLTRNDVLNACSYEEFMKRRKALKKNIS